MRDAHVRDIGHAAIRVSSFRGVKLVPLSDKVRERKMKISSASPLRGGCNGGGARRRARPDGRASTALLNYPFSMRPAGGLDYAGDCREVGAELPSGRPGHVARDRHPLTQVAQTATHGHGGQVAGHVAYCAVVGQERVHDMPEA